MTHYIELTLIANQKFAPYELWSEIYKQLHLTFVETKDENEQIVYGVSFPQYKVQQVNGKTFAMLGSKLRIFAPSEQALIDLNLSNWLQRLQDYIHTASIKPVPTEQVTSYLVVKRHRAKPFSAKRNAAYAARRGLTPEQAQAHFEQTFKPKDLPFIKLQSRTNGQDFSLTIDQQSTTNASHGLFGTYGLSNTSTVPNW